MGKDGISMLYKISCGPFVFDPIYHPFMMVAIKDGEMPLHRRNRELWFYKYAYVLQEINGMFPGYLYRGDKGCYLSNDKKYWFKMCKIKS